MINEFEEIYGIENYDLMFELEFQYYQLTKNEEEK